MVTVTHLRDALDAAERARAAAPRRMAREIDVDLVLLRALVASNADGWQPCRPGQFVDGTRTALAEIRDEIVDDPSVANHLDRAVAYLDAAVRCPECGTRPQAVVDVPVIGTGGPDTRYGDACITRTPSGEWRLYLHAAPPLPALDYTHDHTPTTTTTTTTTTEDTNV